MNPHMPGLAIGSAMLAFHAGLMRGRARHNAYVAATIEGRRRDAEAARIRRLEADVRAARADANAARADAMMTAFLRQI